MYKILFLKLPPHSSVTLCCSQEAESKLRLYNSVSVANGSQWVLCEYKWDVIWSTFVERKLPKYCDCQWNRFNPNISYVAKSILLLSHIQVNGCNLIPKGKSLLEDRGKSSFSKSGWPQSHQLDDPPPPRVLATYSARPRPSTCHSYSQIHNWVLIWWWG